jgi:membrane fusion protein (multidrug efflux system)
MNKPLVAAIALLVVAAAAGGGFWAGKSAVSASNDAGAGKPVGAPAKGGTGGSGGAGAGTAVETARVTMATLPESITAIGTLRSDESVSIRPEVSGRISEILFKEGQSVEKGAVLVRLDAAVQRAEAQQAEANLALAKSRVERARDLHVKNFISAQAKDDAENNYKVAQAAFDLANARLTRLDIRAPFSGIAGLRQVSAGDYVKDGQDIANLEGIDPLKVDFRVPEIFLKKVQVSQALQVSLDAIPQRTFAGRVVAINPLIDAAGRSIMVRATVKNAGFALRPGMFARVRLLTEARADAMTIPEQSLLPSGEDFFVFRVVDGRAARTKVEIGQRQAGIVEIVAGLKAEDVVVTAGQPKIRDGAAVKSVNQATDAGNASAQGIGGLPSPNGGGAKKS